MEGPGDPGPSCHPQSVPAEHLDDERAALARRVAAARGPARRLCFPVHRRAVDEREVEVALVGPDRAAGHRLLVAVAAAVVAELLFAGIVIDDFRSTSLPTVPGGPCGPAGSCPTAKSTLSSEWSRTRAESTALAAILFIDAAELPSFADVMEPSARSADTTCPFLILFPVTASFPSFALLTALFASFGFVTAFAFSCDVPTLFFGTAVTAATLVPPSATSSARPATTMDGDGRRQRCSSSRPPFG